MRVMIIPLSGESLVSSNGEPFIVSLKLSIDSTIVSGGFTGRDTGYIKPLGFGIGTVRNCPSFFSMSIFGYDSL